MDTIQKSGISPSNFYGRKRQEKGDNVTPQLAAMDNCAPPEIEIEEDELMGNPENEHEEVVAECVFFRLAPEPSLMSTQASKNLHLHL